MVDRPAQPVAAIGTIGRAVALARAAHPGPTVAVTTVAVLLGLSTELSGSQLLLVATTVLVGQLSIGWSNDWLDAQRDAAAGRLDKPTAEGAVSVRAVRRAALIAGPMAVPLSLAAGWVGAWHLLLVASGWTYNLGVKGTPWSPVPYLVGFAALPVYVEGVAETPTSWWLAVAGGLLGAAAHFANAAPDVAHDRRLGVLGLPQRIGARASMVVALALLAVVGGLLLSKIEASGTQLTAAALLVAAPILGGFALVASNRIGRPAFVLVMAAAVADVALLVVGFITISTAPTMPLLHDQDLRYGRRADTGALRSPCGRPLGADVRTRRLFSVALATSMGAALLLPTIAGADDASFPDPVDAIVHGDVTEYQWMLPAVNAAAAHTEATGAGVTVAVIDTGVDATHPDLEGKVVPGAILKENEDTEKIELVPATIEETSDDWYGHGSHVAGIVAADDDGNGVTGIAPDAEIMPIDMLPRRIWLRDVKFWTFVARGHRLRSRQWRRRHQHVTGWGVEWDR